MLKVTLQAVRVNDNKQVDDGYLERHVKLLAIPRVGESIRFRYKFYSQFFVTVVEHDVDSVHILVQFHCTHKEFKYLKKKREWKRAK